MLPVKKLVICSFIFMLTLSFGCAMQKPQPKPQQTNSNIQVEVNPMVAQEVKSICKGVDGVEESTAVVLNKEISAAIKVSGFDRLRLKSIKQKTHQKISAQYQDYKVYVTSDKKLFKLIKDIEKQLNQGQKVSLPELQQKVKKINEDMRG